MAKKATSENGGGETAAAPATKFGVYQMPEGSYTYGDKRFAPFTAVECGGDVAAAIDDPRVKFFGDSAKAGEEVRRLRAAREAKLNPKRKE